MTAGRPTLYKKKYCKDVIRLAKEGKLPIKWAVEFQVGKNTLSGWKTEFPEFSVAYGQAMAIVESMHDDEYDNMVTSVDMGKWKWRNAAVFHNYEKTQVEQNITADIKTNVVVEYGTDDDQD